MSQNLFIFKLPFVATGNKLFTDDAFLKSSNVPQVIDVQTPVKCIFHRNRDVETTDERIDIFYCGEGKFYIESIGDIVSVKNIASLLKEIQKMQVTD